MSLISVLCIQSISPAISCPKPCGSENGMFKYLSTAQMFVLLDCLEEAHRFSRTFNSNNEQRTVLMKAGNVFHLMQDSSLLIILMLHLGFRGRTRPNLLRQETTSIMCAIRILYHLLSDENRSSDYDTIESRLLGVINGGLEYFVLLSSEIHREAWTPVLLLILSRILQLQSDQVCCGYKISILYLRCT